jgi:hypothetical protein
MMLFLMQLVTLWTISIPLTNSYSRQEASSAEYTALLVLRKLYSFEAKQLSMSRYYFFTPWLAKSTYFFRLKKNDRR